MSWISTDLILTAEVDFPMPTYERTDENMAAECQFDEDWIIVMDVRDI